MGFAKTGSKVSLGAGCLFGGLLVGSGMLIVEDKHLEGHSLALGSSALMSLSMGYRYIKHGSKPAGVIAALGTISVAYHVRKVTAWSA